MGVTKRAITVIGLQVPIDRISRLEEYTSNRCTCSPKCIDDVKYCPNCGMETKRKRSKRVMLEKVEAVILGNSVPNLEICGYKAFGDINVDKEIYIGTLISSTRPAYSAEGSDPVAVKLDIDEREIDKFCDKMVELGLYEQGRFGIWTIMYLE